MKNWWLIPLGIVVSLAIITSFWAMIIPPSYPVKDSCLDAAAGVSIVDENYTCFGEDKITIQIHSSPGRYELAQIDFEFFDSEGISLEKRNITEDFPGLNGDRVYSFSKPIKNLIV